MSLLPLLRGETRPDLAKRELCFQKNRYLPVAHSDAAIRRGKWKLVWPGVPSTMKKQSARDNPSYLRGIVHPHWEMPLDRELAGAPDHVGLTPRLYNLDSDPSEQIDLSEQRPDLVQTLSQSYDVWFADVMKDWRQSRREILKHDHSYWKDRVAPDPLDLFRGYWLWNKVPAGKTRDHSDPLTVFRGFWTQPDVD